MSEDFCSETSRWVSDDSLEVFAFFCHCCFFHQGIALSFGEKGPTQLQWTGNEIMLRDHEPCILRPWHLKVASPIHCGLHVQLRRSWFICS